MNAFVLLNVVRNWALAYVFMALWGNAFGQMTFHRTQELRFQVRYMNRDVDALPFSGYLAGMDSMHITELKWYVSNVAFYRNDTLVYKEPNSYHLLDLSNPYSLKWPVYLPMAKVNQVRFTLGLDSALNCAGALDGALDPTLGMYWAWNSGYIQFKMEGTHPLSTARNHRFQFHIGGYRTGESTAQEIRMPINPNTNMVVPLDLRRWLKDIDFANENSVMMPGKEAVELAKKFPLMFVP